MWEKLEKFNRGFCRILENVGVVALLLVMLITCVDVVGAKVFLWRLFGAIDMVVLAQAVAMAFGAGMALILGRHIQVEFFVAWLPMRLQGVIASLINLLCFGLLALMVWRLSVLAYSFQVTGEHSATARIPYYPFLYGIALAFVPLCLTVMIDFHKSLRKAVRK